MNSLFDEDSLVDSFMSDCVTLIPATVPDGEGGEKNTWTEGLKFKASFDFQTSEISKIAEAQGAKSLWNIYIPSGVNLEYHTVFKRIADGEIFRITSRDSRVTPDVADLDLRLVSAEDWNLT